MAAFDTIIDEKYLDNFKGYTGNPPSSKEEYDVLDCWIDRSKAPSWDSLKSDIDVKRVQLNREPEYPSLADFADAYYWSQKGDNTKMNEYVAKCDAVKEKFPKGE